MADNSLVIKILSDLTGWDAAPRTIRRDLNEVQTGVMDTKKAVDDLKSTLAGLVGAAALTALVKSSIDAALQMELLNRQFAVFTGSASLAARELQFARDQANRLGLDMQGLTTQYGQFLSAIKGTANEGQKGRAAFIGISEGMAAIGMSAENQGRAWVQLNQGIMKGKFEMQDLKAINEAGLPIFELMADSLGITTAELLKQQTEGKVLAEDVLPKLGESMHNAFGKAATEGANSAQGAINRMNNAVFEAKAAFGQALIPAFTDAVKSITPAIGKLKEFIGGLQILSIKMFAFADKTKAWVDAGGLLGMLSGKNRASFSSSITQINANAESTIDDLMKQYQAKGSDYSAAEKLLQASNKSTKPVGDDKDAKSAAKALKLAEQYEKDYLADMEKWRKAQEQLADTYDKAAIAAVEQRRDRELAILKNQYDQGLLSQADYLDKQYQQQVAASDKALDQLESAALRNDQAYYAALKAEPAKPTDGNPVAVEAYNKAILLTVKLLQESEAAWAKVDAAAAKSSTAAIANEGAKAAIQRENANAALGFEAQLLQAGGQTYAATLKQIEADKLGRKPIDAKTDALRDQLDAVKALKAAQDEANRINAIKDQTTDINISMMNDPYAEQRAAMEERYRREAELIQQNIDLKIAAGTLELDEYEALSAKLLAMAQKRDKDVAASQRNQSLDGWDSVISQAQKAFPKLTGIDKALYALRKDYTVKNKEGVVDETRSNLSMYGAYAGAAGAVFEGLAATQDQSSREGFETAKAFNLAAAVMSTASGMMAQLSGPDGWSPTAWARAAIVGVTGAIQVAQIASTSFGGGASVSSAPSGSFAGASGSSSGGGTGLSNLKTPLTSIQDNRTEETYSRMIASTDNVAVAIGRLSKSMDDLTALFDDGGAGMGLVTNAPGLDITLTKTQTAFSKIAGDAKTIFTDFLSAINPANFISSTMNFLFGGGTSTTGAGIALAVNKGTIAAWDYVSKHKDGGLFGSSSDWTNYTGNSAASSYMGALMQPFVADIKNMAETLRTTFDATAYSGAKVDIATAGKTPEEISAQLEKWMTDTLQGMSMLVVGLQDNVGAYDDAYAMLKKYNDALVTTNQSLELIGATTLQGSFANAKMADALQTLMGGADSFTESVNTYFTTMFTDTEQTTAKTKQAQQQVTLSFADMHDSIMNIAKTMPQQWDHVWTDIDATTKMDTLVEKLNPLQQLIADTGDVIPRTREEFKTLVNSLDLTTDAGAQTFAALMNVSEAFGTVMDAADTLAENQLKMQDLQVRYLNAMGNTDAADAMERQLSAERELQDAVSTGMDAAYISKLKEVLALEEQTAASESAAAATAKATEALTTASKAAESSAESISTAFASLTKAQGTADAQLNGATVGGVQLSGAEYKSFSSFVTFLDQSAGELQKIADMGFPEELQAAVDKITAMVDTASKLLADQVASQRILAGDAAGALNAYQKWTMPKDGFNNADDSFNAGSFNSQYLRNQAKKALELSAEASANALKVVDAMQVMGAFDYSGNKELQMFALWDNITAFSNGFSADVGKTITDNMRPALDALSEMQVAKEYAPQGPGVNSITAAKMQANALNGLYIGADRTQYHGTAEIAFGKGLDELNQLMKAGGITSDEFSISLKRLEDATETTSTSIMTLNDLLEAQAVAAQKVKEAGVSSLNYYMGQISAMGHALVQTAIDTGTALGLVTESIGRMKSWTDVLTISLQAADALADPAQAAKAKAIAAAAADAQKRLTTQDAATAASALQGMTAFSGMDSAKLRDISLLIDGLKSFDPTSFENAFTRISGALVDGLITVDQYAALYSYSMQVYEGTAKNALETLKQTGSDAMQILENAINKAKEAQQVIVDQLTTLSDSLHSLIEGLQTPTDETLINRQAAQAQLRELVASNTLPAPGEFDAAMQALSEPSKQLFGSFESYAEDFYKTAIDLSTLSTRTDSQLSIAEQEIQRLDDILKTAQDQWDVAMGTKLAVMSVEEAVVNLQNAIVALSQGQTPSVAIAGLNSFAVGTNYVPYDMVAQIHEGERIIPAADNYQLMQGNDEMLAELKALRSEVSQLRSEQRSQAAVVATNTDKTAKALTRVMPDGDALAVRIAA